jgi:hypothetical protein
MSAGGTTVGPAWDRVPGRPGFRSSPGMLKTRLSRRVGVVRLLGRFGQGGATRHYQRVPWVPDRSDGDFDEHRGAASSDVASAGRSLACLQHQAGRVGGVQRRAQRGEQPPGRGRRHPPRRSRRLPPSTCLGRSRLKYQLPCPACPSRGHDAPRRPPRLSRQPHRGNTEPEPWPPNQSRPFRTQQPTGHDRIPGTGGTAAPATWSRTVTETCETGLAYFP